MNFKNLKNKLPDGSKGCKNMTLIRHVATEIPIITQILCQDNHVWNCTGTVEALRNGTLREIKRLYE